MTAEITATEFFSSFFPYVAAQNAVLFEASRGAIAFEVRGEGQWTIELGDLECPVHVGFRTNASVRIWCSVAGFKEFFTGTLSAERIQSADFRVMGDTNVMRRFGVLLGEASNTLSIRIRRKAKK